jgi:hypothetical protein
VGVVTTQMLFYTYKSIHQDRATLGQKRRGYNYGWVVPLLPQASIEYHEDYRARWKSQDNDTSILGIHTLA